MQPPSSLAITKVAGRPSATLLCQVRLRSLAPRPRLVRSGLQRHVLAPGATEAHPGASASARAGSAPVQAVLCPRPSAAGAGAQEEGARGSAYLPRLTDKSRSVQRLARACLAADPGKPGAARSSPSRASAARLAEPAQGKAPSAAAGPARPARRPPRRSSGPSGPAQRSARGGRGSAGSGDARALACSRRGGASHSRPASCSSDVLIYCNCLRRDRGAGPGGGSGREVLAAAPGTQLLHGAARPGERAPEPRARRLCARLAARRAEPWAGGGGVGAARGRAGPRAWGGGSGGSGGAPARRHPSPELEEAVEGAGGGCRLRAGCTAARPRGLWAAGGAALPRNLLSPPWSRLWSSWSGGSSVFSWEGSLGTP